jgi:hypothetical protein
MTIDARPGSVSLGTINNRSRCPEDIFTIITWVSSLGEGAHLERAARGMDPAHARAAADRVPVGSGEQQPLDPADQIGKVIHVVCGLDLTITGLRPPGPVQRTRLEAVVETESQRNALAQRLR